MATTLIEHTPLWQDIKDVLYSEHKTTQFEFRGMLHTEFEDLPILKIDNMDLVRDYVNNIGDIVRIEFKMPLGEYIARLYPFRANLEFTIKRLVLNEVKVKIPVKPKILTTRYKAIFLIEENPVYTNSEFEQLDVDTLNNMEIVQVKLQLLNRSLEPIRVKTVHGVFKQVNQKQLIHTLLAGESLKIQVDGKPAIDGINIIEPDNSDTRQHVIFPSGTPITTIPTFLQDKMGGVYNAGIGNYLQRYDKRLLWFVYPTWNHKRFDKTKDNKAIIYALPEGKFSGIERTYDVDASILKILVTGARKYQDSADIDYMNEGSGFRMVDARAFMKKPVELTIEGPRFKRSNLNTEIAAEDRKDNLNHVPRTQEPSSNPFKQYSIVNIRNIARIDVLWENADPELIYPGMPCKYIFLDDGKPVELKGTIGFVHSVTQLQGMGIQGKTYLTNCTLTILAEQRIRTRKLPDKPPQGTF